MSLKNRLISYINSRRFRIFVAIFLLLAIAILHFSSELVARKKLQQMASFTGIHLAFEKLSYNYFTKVLKLYDVKVSNADFAISSDQLNLRVEKSKPYRSKENLYYKKRFINIESDNLHVQPISLKTVSLSSAFGYDNFECSIDMQITQEFPDIIIIINDVHLNSLGSIKGVVRYDNITANIMDGSLADMFIAKPIDFVEIVFTDDGVASHVISRFAKDVGSDYSQAKGRILSGINRVIHTQFKEESVAKNNLTSIYLFIDNPESIKVNGVDVFLPKYIHQGGWRKLLDGYSEGEISLEYIN